MKNKIIRGDTVEEQIRSIDQFLISMRRRAQRKIVLGRVPIPVSGFANFIDDRGVFFRYASPFGGTVSSMSFDFVGRFEEGTSVSALLSVPSGNTRGVKVPVKKGVVTIPLDWAILAGDKIIMSVDNFANLPKPDINDRGGTIFEEIWVWFSLFPAVREHNFVKEDIPEEEGVI